MHPSMNDRIAFSTEHFTVHRLDDPERPYRIDNGTDATRLGEPACVTIRMEYGKARIAWMPECCPWLRCNIIRWCLPTGRCRLES